MDALGAAISVLVVDDHAVFAEALQERLRAEPDFRPVGIAITAADAVSRLLRSQVDVAVVDYALGDGTGVALAKSVRTVSPDIRVVMLSAVDSVEAVVDAIEAGARAWLPKSVDTAHLVRVVRGVHHGQIWLDPTLLGQVLPRLCTRLRTPGVDPLAVLTPREREVLDAMADGLTRAQIAAALQLSANTVRTHAQHVLAKLGAHSSLEVVTIALRNRHR